MALADAYDVSGAGSSEWNGRYEADGEDSGFYRYKLDNLHYLWMSNNGPNASGAFINGVSFYDAGSYMAYVNNGTWAPADIGVAPAPTVTAVVPDTIAPTYDSSETTTDGTKVLVNLIEADSPPVLPATGVTGFKVKVNGTERSITSAKITNVAGEVSRYEVSGAGTSAFNGNYEENGVVNGYPAYKNANNKWLAWGLYSGLWGLWDDSSAQDALSPYFGGSDTSNPAEGTWGVDTASSPAPTVTAITSPGSTIAELTLATKVSKGDAITVEYDSISGNVEDSASNAMESFGPQSVTNKNTLDESGPVIDTVTGVSIEDVGSVQKLTIPFLEDGTVIGSTGFSLAGLTRGAATLSSPSITSNVLTYSISRGIYIDEGPITLDYVPGDIKDNLNNLMEAVSGVPVTNNSTMADTTAPTVASISFTGGVFTVTFTEVETAPVLPATGIKGFVFKSGGVTLNTADGEMTSGTTATFALTTGSVYNTDTLTASYSNSTGNVTDSAVPPNAMSSFSGVPVTNNSAAIDPRLSTRKFNVITETGTDEHVDLAASTSKGYVATASVVACNGVNPTLDVVIEHSDTEVEGDFSALATFDQFTKRGVQMLVSSSDTATVKRYVRVKKTVGGTNPEFVLLVAITPK